MSEEWVDCTEDWGFEYRRGQIVAIEKKYRYDMQLFPKLDYFGCDILASPTLPVRVIIENNLFRIERRVEKKYCPTCGQEVKK
jgi:hypothetical protein